MRRLTLLGLVLVVSVVMWARSVTAQQYTVIGNGEMCIVTANCSPLPIEWRVPPTHIGFYNLVDASHAVNIYCHNASLPYVIEVRPDHILVGCAESVLPPTIFPPTPTATVTPTLTMTPSPTPTATFTPTATPTLTPTVMLPTVTPAPTITPTEVMTMAEIDVAVAASGDDGIAYSDGGFNNNDATNYFGALGNGVDASGWARFTGLSGLGGATITAATLELFSSEVAGTPQFKVRAIRGDAPTAPTSNADYFGRTLTTAGVDWDGFTGLSWNTSPSLVDIIQELADDYDPTTIVLYWLEDGAAAGNQAAMWMWDRGDHSVSAKLHIEYTEAGGGYTLSADQGSYAVTGQAVNLLAARQLATAQGSFTLTGQSANLLFGRLLSAAQGDYTLAGQAAALVIDRLLAAEQGGYNLTGQSVGLLVSRLLAAAQGSYILTGQDATLTYTPSGGYLLSAESGSYALTGQVAGLLVDRLLTAEQGTYVLSGQDAQLLMGHLLQANQGSYSLSGQAATLLANRSMAAAPGSYILSGRPVTLVWSGEQAPVTPGSRVYVIPAEDRTYVIVFEDRTFVVQ